MNLIEFALIPLPCLQDGSGDLPGDDDGKGGGKRGEGDVEDLFDGRKGRQR